MEDIQRENTQKLIQQPSPQQQDKSIPSSTDIVLIFPFVAPKNKYTWDFYEPSLTDGRMRIDELNQFFGDVEFIVNQKFKLVNSLTCLWIFLIPISLFGLVFYDISSVRGAGLIILSILVYFMIWVFLFMILGYIIKSRTRQALTLLEPVIGFKNVGLKSVGLRWKLPESFPKWIELWKDYKEQPEYYPMSVSFQGVQQNDHTNSYYPSYGDPNADQTQYSQYPQVAQNYYSTYGQNSDGNHQGNMNNVYHPPQQASEDAQRV